MRDNVSFIFFFIILFIGVIIYSAFFSKNAIIKRKIKKAVRKNISEVQDNEVCKIIGEVKYLDKTLTAPLSKRKCSYYYVLVERHHSGKNGGWRTLIEEEKGTEFIVKDTTGTALIKMNKISSIIEVDREYNSGFLNDANDTLEKFLNKHKEESTGLIGFNRTLRYKEGIIEEGENIVVMGKAKWINNSDNKIPTHSRKVLAINITETEPVYISDDNSIVT